MKAIEIDREVNIYPYGKGIVKDIIKNPDFDVGMIKVDTTKKVEDPIGITFDDKLKIERDDHQIEASVADIEDKFGLPWSVIHFKEL